MWRREVGILGGVETNCKVASQLYWVFGGHFVVDMLTIEIIVSAEHPTAVGAQEREVCLVKCLVVEEGVGEVGGKHLIQSKYYIWIQEISIVSLLPLTKLSGLNMDTSVVPYCPSFGKIPDIQ